MYEGEFKHEGDRCTFEVLLARASLDDPISPPSARSCTTSNTAPLRPPNSRQIRYGKRRAWDRLRTEHLSLLATELAALKVERNAAGCVRRR
jgi:hypothetical protein